VRVKRHCLRLTRTPGSGRQPRLRPRQVLLAQQLRGRRLNPQGVQHRQQDEDRTAIRSDPSVIVQRCDGPHRVNPETRSNTGPKTEDGKWRSRRPHFRAYNVAMRLALAFDLLARGARQEGRARKSARSGCLVDCCEQAGVSRTSGTIASATPFASAAATSGSARSAPIERGLGSFSPSASASSALSRTASALHRSWQRRILLYQKQM
jgi:hypothetical protein